MKTVTFHKLKRNSNDLLHIDLMKRNVIANLYLNKDDATIMSASKDMYKALIVLLNDYNIDTEDNTMPEHWKIAIKAISKAEGK
jgi:hypothetical protein